MKKNKILVLCIAILFFFSGCGTIIQPPAPQEIEEVFQKYREEIQVVTDYLQPQKPPVTIYNSQELPEPVSQAVRTLMRQAGCYSIHYSGDTVHFVFWTRFTDAGCGIAYSPEKTLEADMDFLTQAQPLSEENWFYYVEDYALWRIENNK